MKNSITSCLKAEADYKQNAAKIAELETQLKSFQESENKKPHCSIKSAYILPPI